MDSRTIHHLRSGARVAVAGIPVRPHRPPTRSGKIVVYVSLEDEYGLTEVTVPEEVYQRCGGILFSGRPRSQPTVIAITGETRRQGNGISLLARRMAPLQWSALHVPEAPRRRGGC